ncbi:MAG: helix-turn-helix domain-containing protein [candidate division Zixibacteria bacterium]
MSRKTAEREIRQSYILDAARGLFAQQGIENTSMEDIASAAEYTRRTLYSYFKSRDEICLMVLIEDNKTRWREQQKAMELTRSGLDKITIWGKTLYDFSRRNPQSLYLQLYWDLKGLDPDSISGEAFESFDNLNNELAEGLRGIFQMGIKDGSLRADLKVDLCISQFLYSIRSIINRALSTTYSFACFESDEYIDHYLDMFSRGIRYTGGTIK